MNTDNPRHPNNWLSDEEKKASLNRNQPIHILRMEWSTCEGLTKREYAAVHLAAGLLSGPDSVLTRFMEERDESRSTIVALLAVKHADVLFDELEK